MTRINKKREEIISTMYESFALAYVLFVDYFDLELKDTCYGLGKNSQNQ